MSRLLEVVRTPRYDTALVSVGEFIEQDNPDAAQTLFDEVREKAAQAIQHPLLYKAGRVRGTREIVVRSNYILVYRIAGDVLNVVRVLHARQQWPAPWKK